MKRTSVAQPPGPQECLPVSAPGPDLVTSPGPTPPLVALRVGPPVPHPALPAHLFLQLCLGARLCMQGLLPNIVPPAQLPSASPCLFCSCMDSVVPTPRYLFLGPQLLLHFWGAADSHRLHFGCWLRPAVAMALPIAPVADTFIPHLGCYSPSGLLCSQGHPNNSSQKHLPPEPA